jgi:hypothetical protein
MPTHLPDAVQSILDWATGRDAAPGLLLAANDPNVGGGVDRAKLPAADFAGKNRSYPIVTPGDVADAAAAIGRAGSDNYSADELKRRIIAIAKRKGPSFLAKLPKAWRDGLGLSEPERALYVALAEPFAHEDLRRLITDALEDAYGGAEGSADHPWDMGCLPCPIATYDDHCIVDWDGHYWSLPYTLDGGEVQFGTPVKVQRTFAPIDGATYDGDDAALVGAGQLAATETPPSSGPAAVPGGVAEPAGDLLLSEFTWGCDLECGEGKPIQIMRPGIFQHPEYGEFSITQQDMEEIVKNFNDRVRGQDIPIDVDHDHKAGAIGWMKSVAMQNGNLYAVPEWTEAGAADVADGKYRYFSPHFGPWKDPESGQAHRIVLMSGAVTNFPFLKNMEPIALSEVAAQVRPEGVPMPEPNVTAESPVLSLAEVQAQYEKQLAEAQDREKALAERMARMEHEGLVRRLTERIHGSGNNSRWVGQEDAQLTFLVKLAETFGEESTELAHYCSEQDTHAQRLRSSAMFQEIGSTGDGAPTTALGEFAQKRDALVAAGMALAEATAKVATEDPALYQRYDHEQKRAALRGGE